MVDFPTIQGHVYYGYTQSATRLGTSHAIYRSANGMTPIQSGNFLFDTFIAVDQNYKYTTGRKYGNNQMNWQFLPQNGLSLQNYDYMVGSEFTYFIADIAPDGRLTPPVCVECNTVISISSITSSTTPGINPYQERMLTPVLVNCPCSILEYTRMDMDNMKLPTSVKNPTYNITLPDFPGVIIGTGDEIDDDKGRRLLVIAAETTAKSLGLRLLVQEKST